MTAPETEIAHAPATRFLPFALRDAAIVAAAGLLWWLAAARSAGDGMLSDLAGVVVGLAVGVSVFALHEWGHLIGALLSRSVVRPADSLRSAYLFSYDSRRNSRPQFLVMSVGGFLVTGAAVAFVVLGLPDDLLATRVARGSVAFLATLTVVLEFPLVFVALVRRTLPPVETFASHRREQRAAA